MSFLANSTDLYQLGGSLEFNHPTYVVRQADNDFYGSLKAGQFCYVLNSRQTGKSSLKVQTMYRLQEDGIACGEIDLSGIGSQSISDEKWYSGIIIELVSSFGLDINRRVWWSDHNDISPVHRFNEFIKKVLLTQITKNIVIFIDEIDSILGLKFKDDFFAVIRHCYNKRADNSEYKRLTFALLGVATPSDLIADRDRTPFNIGVRIELCGFQLHETKPLAKGLTKKISNPEAVLKEVLAWTGGQPFLTQKLCKLIAQKSNLLADDLTLANASDWVKELVISHIIKNWEFQDEPEHLKTIRNRILVKKQLSVRFLGIYQTILQQGEISADGSYEQIQLQLSGLVVKLKGKLKVYNRIYKTVFNDIWVDKKLADLRPYSEAITAWLNSNFQDESRLLQGEVLQEAQAWADGKSLDNIDYRFLNASQDFNNQQLQKALDKSNKIIAIAEQKAKRYIRIGSVILCISLVGAAIAWIFAIKSSQNLQETQQATKIEQAGVFALQEFETSANKKVEALISAMKAGQDLKSLIKDGRPVQNYPTISPLLALQRILNEINYQKQFYSINDLSFSPDGQKLASAGQDGIIRIWHVSGKLLLKTKADDNSLTFVNFNSDSQRLLTIGESGTTKIWNISGKQLFELQGISSRVESLSLSEDGKVFAIKANNDDEITAWNFLGNKLVSINWDQATVNSANINLSRQLIARLEKGGKLQLLNFSEKKLAQWQVNQSNVYQVAFSVDGQFIITLGKGIDGVNTIKMWDLSGNQLSQLQARQSDFSNVYFNRIEKPIITVENKDNNYNIVRVWNLSGKQLAQWQVEKSSLKSIVYNKKGMYFGTVGNDATIRLWNFSGKKLAEIKGELGEINNFQISPDGQLIATAGNNGAIKIWDSSGKQVTEIAKSQRSITNSVWLRLNNESIKYMMFSPDWKYIVTRNQNDVTKIWNRSGKQLTELKGYQGKIKYFSFSSNSKYVVTVTTFKKVSPLTIKSINYKVKNSKISDNTVIVWNLSGQKLGEIKNFQSNVKFALLSADGQRIATVEENGTARLWDRTGQEVAKLKGHSRVIDVGFSPTDALMATVGEEGKLQLWNLSGKKLAAWTVNQHKLDFVGFNSGGKSIITTGQDYKVRIWDLSGKQLNEVKIYGGSIYFARLSPDGQKISTLQSGSNGFTHILWDLSGRKIAEFAAIQNFSLSPDWQQIATLDYNYGRLRIQHLRGLDELLADSCNWLQDYFVSHPEALQELKVCQKKEK